MEILRTNLTEARGEAERAAGLQQQVALLKVRRGVQGACAAAQVAYSPLTMRVFGNLTLHHVGQELAICAAALLGLRLSEAPESFATYIGVGNSWAAALQSRC